MNGLTRWSGCLCQHAPLFFFSFFSQCNLRIFRYVSCIAVLWSGRRQIPQLFAVLFSVWSTTLRKKKIFKKISCSRPRKVYEHFRIMMGTGGNSSLKAKQTAKCGGSPEFKASVWDLSQQDKQANEISDEERISFIPNALEPLLFVWN